MIGLSAERSSGSLSPPSRVPSREMLKKVHKYRKKNCGLWFQSVSTTAEKAISLRFRRPRKPGISMVYLAAFSILGIPNSLFGRTQITLTVDGGNYSVSPGQLSKEGYEICRDKWGFCYIRTTVLDVCKLLKFNTLQQRGRHAGVPGDNGEPRSVTSMKYRLYTEMQL